MKERKKERKKGMAGRDRNRREEEERKGKDQE